MPLISWTSDLSVGVESIDADHKMLIELINQLDEAIKSGKPRETVNRVLDALVDYTKYHFDREEQLMRASGYPDINAHARTHAMLRAQVQDIRARYRRNPESIHSREVLAFLKNWLSAHIVGRDRLYAPFVRSMGTKLDEADRAFDFKTPRPTPLIASERR